MRGKWEKIQSVLITIAAESLVGKMVMRSQITINLCILSLVSAGIACITIMHVASYQISVKVSGSCLLVSKVEIQQ